MPQPKEPEKPKLILTLLPGISFAAALLCPLGVIYLNNKGQFTLNTSTAVLLFLFLMGIITLLCAAPLSLCRKRPAVYSVLNAVFLSSAVTILIHQQFWSEIFPKEIFNRNLSQDMVFLTVFHLILLLTPVAAAIRYRERVLKWTGKITSVIVLLILTSLAGPVFSKSAAEDYDFKNYALLENDKFTVASDRNIIIVVVDCMGERIIKEVLRKFPEMQQVLKDFTCFDNMASPLPRTMYAVPAMLTGIDFPRGKNGEPAPDADHAAYVSTVFRTEKALFTLCRKQGWRREAYPYMLQAVSCSPETVDNSMVINDEVKKQSFMKILDTALDKYIPFYLKKLLKEYYYIATDQFVQPAQEVNQTPEDVFDRVFFRRLNQEFKVGRYARGLKYYHLQGAHEPIRTDEKLAMNSNTLKYRQLRGSLKNLEVLLRKLKKAGLYDRAAIIVTGDHSERYTPEIAAFIKRPGESHDRLVFNSVPCQVSDLCGTISRIGGLDPNAASLFDRPPRRGSLNRVRRNLAAMLDFPGWQPAEKAFGASEVSDTIPVTLDHDNLIIDMGSERLAGLKSIAMTAENLETGKICRTGMDMPRTADYTRSSLSGFPDGIYRICVSAKCAKNDPKGPKLTDLNWIVPQFLIVRNGKMKLADNPDRLKPEMLRVGQELLYEPMTLFPQLVFPENWKSSNTALHLTEDESFGVRVPAGRTGLTLEIQIRRVPAQEGDLFISVNDEKVHKVRLTDDTDTVIPVPVPAGSGKTGGQVLKIKIKFQSILRNREKMKTDSYEIIKFRLTKSPRQ